MRIKQLRALTMALAMVGVTVLGNPRTVTADILVTITDGTGAAATTQTTEITNNTFGYVVTSIGSYSLNLETVVTNYPGSNTSGQISTTVNVLNTTGTGTLEQLNVQVQLVNYNSTTPSNSTNLLWTTPNLSTVTVYAGSSFTPSGNSTSGTVTTNTYYNSTSSTTTTGLGSSTISASNSVGGAPGLNYVNAANPAGTYTLSQTVTLSGVNAGASGFNFGATSLVHSPEPSSLAVAGIGGLGLIGYSLRRRKALGA
jgi:hypothetical protein